jgi:hypothetical protein
MDLSTDATKVVALDAVGARKEEELSRLPGDGVRRQALAATRGALRRNVRCRGKSELGAYVVDRKLCRIEGLAEALLADRRSSKPIVLGCHQRY